MLESFLIGSVISSTDAASVFSILRSRKLNLKDNLASLLEVESGSNDPASYMLTMIVLSLMSSDSQPIIKMVLMQIVLSVIFGVILAFGASFLMRHVSIEIDGFYPLFVSAIAVLGYGLCGLTGGNGYLCVYLIGIILGNSKILHKRLLFTFLTVYHG